MRHLRTFSKFSLVGVVNTGVDFAVFWLLHGLLGVPLLVANTLSYACGIINSFVCNKRWTFRDQDRNTTAQFYRFVGLNLISLLLSNALVMAFSQVLPVLAAKLVAIIGTLVWNYWTSHRFVYRRSAL